MTGEVLVCSGGLRFYEICEREILDLPVFEFRTTVVLELYQLRCRDCGPKGGASGSAAE